ncbi:MAG: AzlD domain-containing protein [Treponema sp.]|jgi:branched-subunit amino acid transport protein AzlD|nr:AzlD domain-containing protein [Treponema sp.]
MIKQLILILVMGLVIFLCRLFPFLVFHGRKIEKNPKEPAFRGIGFVEKVVPPVAMTVLAFNAIAASIKDGIVKSAPFVSIPVIAASVFTALIHLWKRNSLISIFGGVAVYMFIERLLHGW